MPSPRSKKSRLKSKPPKLQSYLHTLKKFFDNSWLIVGTRLADVGGFITAVIGALDWTPLMNSSGMSRTQVMTTGCIIILMGISHELALKKTLPDA